MSVTSSSCWAYPTGSPMSEGKAEQSLKCCFVGAGGWRASVTSLSCWASPTGNPMSAGRSLATLLRLIVHHLLQSLPLLYLTTVSVCVRDAGCTLQQTPRTRGVARVLYSV